MTTNNTNTNTNTSKTLISAILARGIEADTFVKLEGRQVLKSSTSGKIYICNPETKRAFIYEADGTGCKAISLDQFRNQCKAAQARVQREVETNKRIREKVQKFEAQTRTDHNAVLLDAEREDSKFDYRRAEDILSRTEADSYEETDSLLDEDVKDLRGHHKAVLVSWENVKGRVETAKDGSQRFYKPNVLLTFSVDGELVPSRAYTKQWESFKIQANQKFHGLFNYMKSSKVLDELVSAEFDIWLKWNELFYNRETNTQGEWQADFYDAAAYRARKAEQAKAGFVRGSYGRPTENKATR